MELVNNILDGSLLILLLRQARKSIVKRGMEWLLNLVTRSHLLIVHNLLVLLRFEYFDIIQTAIDLWLKYNVSGYVRSFLIPLCTLDERYEIEYVRYVEI